jgi:hypothetical protein
MEDEVAQDDADRSLWKQDFILSVEERFQPQSDLVNGSHT